MEIDSKLVKSLREKTGAGMMDCKQALVEAKGNAAEAEVIPFDGIGVISNLTPSEVRAWLESEAIHHSQAPDGTHLICLNSLLKRVQKSNTA